MTALNQWGGYSQAVWCLNHTFADEDYASQLHIPLILVLGIINMMPALYMVVHILSAVG